MADDQLHSRLAWRLLRSLLPRWYANLYAADLLNTHVEMRRRQSVSAVRLWAALTWDVLLTATQLRADALLRGSPDRAIQSPTTGAHVRNQLRHAARSLARSPAFSMTIVLTLAIGMGATATLFTVIDRLLLSGPEKVVKPDQVRRIYVHAISPFSKSLEYGSYLTYPDYQDLKRVSAFDAVAAYSPITLTMGDRDASERIRAELASASYFPLLGAVPSAGRFYFEDEDRIGANPVAVLSHGFWRRRFGGNSAVLGSRLRIGKGEYTVIGIASTGFTGVDIAPVDVWLPLVTAQSIQAGTQWATARTWWWLAAVARVNPTGAATGAEEATSVYRAGRASVRGNDPNARVDLGSIVAGRGPKPSEETRVAPALAGLALMVFLMACANAANLFLARSVQRRRATAIQTALGLTRRTLVLQLILEVVLLAAGGGVLALLLAWLATPALFRTLLPDAALTPGVSARLVGFMSAAVIAAGMLAGVIPAMRSSRVDAAETLRSARETRGGASMRRALLFAQAALCVVLLVGAGLFLRSFERARDLDMGMDLQTLIVQFEMRDGSRFGDVVDDASYAAVERFRALPGVANAAVTSMPFFYGNMGITLRTESDSIPNGGNGPYFYGAGGGYFEAQGLRIVRGRALTDDDDRASGARVVVVSDALARLAFRTENPIGRCLYVMEGDAPRPVCSEVVGVVEDVLPAVRASRPNLNVYLPPHHPDLGPPAAGTVVVRTRGNPLSAIGGIRAAALRAASGIRTVEVQPLGNLLDSQLRSWRLGATLLTAFGLLALLVAGAGIYSTLAFDVAQRRFELGVRSALGASASALVGASTSRALLTCGAGVAAGLLAALAIARFAESLLFQVSTRDPAVYGLAFAALVVAILLSAAMPAWRAVKADPRKALQAE